MKYTDHQHNEKSFLSLTSLSIALFQYLLPYFEASHNEYLRYHEMDGKIRAIPNSRSNIIYKNSPLPTIEERLFFILVYLKNNPLQEYHAASFGMDQQHCNIFIHGLRRILESSLSEMELMPAQTQKEFARLLADISKESTAVLIQDATEREIPRPVDPAAQQENYSGKKKKHTVKNAVIIAASCLILFSSPTVCGTMHDKKMADTLYDFPHPCVLYQDTGYQGYHPEGVTVMQPVKKPKGKELSKETKESNKEISSFRIRVEHAIGSIKRMRIVKDECRLRADNFVDRIFGICAALHNLRINHKQWNYKNEST